MKNTTIQPRPSSAPEERPSSSRGSASSSGSSNESGVYANLKRLRNNNEDLDSAGSNTARRADDRSGLPSPPKDSYYPSDVDDTPPKIQRSNGNISNSPSVRSLNPENDEVTSRPSNQSFERDELPKSGLPQMMPMEDYSNPRPTAANNRAGNSDRAYSERDRAGTIPQDEPNSQPSPKRSGGLFGGGFGGGTTKDEPKAVIAAAPPQNQQNTTPDVSSVPPQPARAALEVIPSGPKNVYVNQEANYEFRVVNNSAVSADEVVVNIEIPVWVEIAQPDVTLGTTAWTAVNTEMNKFVWKVGKLKPKQSATVVLRITPREAKPLNLVPWFEIQQTSMNVAIEVQQPNIEMSIEGPSEAFWGAKETYALRIRNTGNGDAKSLKLMITASGSEPENAPIDLLRAGEEYVLGLDLIPQLSGDLQIHVQASGPYGLSAEAHKQVIIHRAELDTIVEGPGFQFVGNPMEYYITTRNRGTAAARNVEIVVTIPSGTKYLSHSEGGQIVQGEHNEIVWRIDMLPPGQEYSCALLCEARREGEAVLGAQVIADTGLHSNGSATTVIEAIADVVVRIEPPINPVEVGADAEYQVTVTNRGTKTAQGIDTTIDFSQGLSPINVTGMAAQMEPNTVYLEHVPNLGPGQTATARIKASAQTEGNHKIRATMSCQSTGTNVSVEETKYYYQRRSVGLRNSVEPQREPVTNPMAETLSAPYPDRAPFPQQTQQNRGQAERGQTVASPPLPGNNASGGTMTMTPATTPPATMPSASVPLPPQTQTSPYIAPVPTTSAHPGSLQTPPSNISRPLEGRTSLSPTTPMTAPVETPSAAKLPTSPVPLPPN